MKKSILLAVLVLLVGASSLFSSSFALIESFTALWCGPCKAADPLANKLMDQTDNILVVHYHVWGDGWDFDESNARADEYGVEGVPTFVVGGTKKVVGNAQGLYQMLSLNASNALRKMDFPGELLVDWDGKMIQVDVSSHQDLSGLSLQVLLVEDNVYDPQEGDQRNVVRAIFSENSRTLESRSSFSYSPNVPSDWNAKNLFAVAFLQDPQTGQILVTARE
ncbi:MAG TPA: thioredoxin domain-containing protein [Thermotogota bacterium]|nr:thioredoxin domain-containing protein [Thermotogota bacterium]HRW92309.1 thioredoxin domain-containing protein [Thermotogota bacterium]